MNPANKPGKHSASAVTGETIKRDREALKLEVEVLAAVAGVKLERLRGFEAGTYSASGAMRRELRFTIHIVESLRTEKPSGLDLSNAPALKNFVRTVYWYGARPRDLREWKKTFEEMQKEEEAASDVPPYENPPAPSVVKGAL